jgi:hypothetical protein
MTMLPMGMGTQMAAGMMNPEKPKKKTGMFGSGANIGEMLLGALSGYLAARGNPMGAMGLHAINQRRQNESDAQRMQEERENQFQDFVRKESWKIANPGPNQQQPHYFEDNAGNLMAVGPDGKPQMVHKDPLQWKLVPNGLGGVVPVNIQQLMGGQGQQGLPQTLSDSDWGGPTPQASGGFPY